MFLEKNKFFCFCRKGIDPVCRPYSEQSIFRANEQCTTPDNYQHTEMFEWKAGTYFRHEASDNK